MKLTIKNNHGLKVYETHDDTRIKRILEFIERDRQIDEIENEAGSYRLEGRE
jgi:hypothetical protein